MSTFHVHRVSIGRLVLAACVVVCFGVSTRLALAGDEQPQVVYLHTEFLPYWESADTKEPNSKPKYSTDNRLSREIARQAFGITLREEFGVIVKDGTLYESLPKPGKARHLALLSRRDGKGNWYLKLFTLNEERIDQKKPKPLDLRGLWENEKPVFEMKTTYLRVANYFVQDATENFETLIRTEFIDAARAVGFEPQVKTPWVSDPLQDKFEHRPIEDLLNQVDFVANFSAVRKVHQAIRETGPSAKKLGLLVRGYTNLGLLTSHHKNACRDLFMARAMLYARRLEHLNDDDAFSRMHHAYVMGLNIIQRYAESDIQTADELREKSGNKVAKRPTDVATWEDLLRIYLTWNRESLLTIANNKQEPLAGWARRLWFEQVNFARYRDEIISAFGDSASQIPTAYGIYDSCQRTDAPEAMQMATQAAADAFQKFLPGSLRRIDDMPRSVIKVKAGGEAFCAHPRDCARALRREVEVVPF